MTGILFCGFFFLCGFLFTLHSRVAGLGIVLAIGYAYVWRRGGFQWR